MTNCEAYGALPRSGHHKVCGLRSVAWAAPPLFSKASPRNPLARRGLAFERNAARTLSRHIPVLANPWIVFEDSTGRHFAQPDLLLWPDSSRIILVEVKLSFTLRAISQLLDLYVPLLERLVSRGTEICPVVLSRNPGPLGGQALATMRTLQDFAPLARLFWDGRTPLALRTAI